MKNKKISEYFRFAGPGRMDKAVNSLLGLVEGVAIDGHINAEEIALLKIWLEDHRALQSRHPFSELVPVVSSALADGVLDTEERADILWLCGRLSSTEFYQQITADLQRLHGVVGGIAADGHVTEEELRGLSAWLDDHEHLRTCWPYDEISAVTTQVLADHRIDDEEQRTIIEFFREFVALLDDRTITAPLVKVDIDTPLMGVCAVMPEIKFPENSFCFTGASGKFKRSEFEALVNKLGGRPVSGVSNKLHYLVIGASGNPCWAYACYGRKVEKAVSLRKLGARIVLVHENDFHDAVLDA